MPKPLRCVYRENGRRCTKNGTVKLGDASVCGAHAIAFAEAAQVASHLPFGGGIAQAFSELLSGGRVRQETFQQAAHELFTALGIDPRGATRRPSGYPPPGAMPGAMPGGQQRRQAPRQPPRAQIPQDELARRRARSTLGFGGEPLTVEMVKERRRELAKQHHPDAGGSVQNMAMINDAADVLLAALEAA